MSDSSRSRRFEYAVFVPTGERVSIDDVSIEQKRGPWRCPSEECEVRLKHRRGTLRKSPSGPSPVSAHWCQIRRDDTHVASCSTPSAATSTSFFSKRLNRAIRLSETVLLGLGRHTEPEVGAGGSSYLGSGESLRYGATAGTLLKLLALMEERGGHEGMRQYFYRHDGSEYEWDQIAYESTGISYERILATKQKIFNQGTWPWLVWGSVGRVTPTSAVGRHQLDLFPRDQVDGGRENRVTAFFSNTDQHRAFTAQLTVGTEVVVLLSNVNVAKFHGVYGNLDTVQDIAIVAD